MKRLASWLRQIANEIDPPARRGRPSRAAERNAAAVDALFAAEGTALSIWDGSEYAPVNGVSDLEIPHGWPQEPIR